jgi:GT2 family glycosyltransferase
MTHDGAPSLRRTLTAIAAQGYRPLELIAVDNASDDGTAELLIDLLGPERVVLSDVDLGVPLAVDLALAAVDAEDVRSGRPGSASDDLVLLLHDDLELAPDAVQHLVGALAADEQVAIVGPKLRWADEPEQLQSVGASIDLTGRVDDGIDPGELDQGQRDGDRRVLFVPTAGMLIRRRVFDALGRFDARAHAFREDLDLCWRAAVAGHDVEVVPAAVGRHAALAAEHRRTGRVAELGPRYLAERNTLTALIKNYSPRRLAVLLPLALVVGLAKIAGFLLTRRFSDARATLAAWGWNVTNLRGTLRRRRAVQAMRRRSDAEIAPLFGRVTPRVQAYLEAMLDRLTGEAAPGAVGTAETQPSAVLQGELSLPDDSERPEPGRLDPTDVLDDAEVELAPAVEDDVERMAPPLSESVGAEHAHGPRRLLGALAARIVAAPVRSLALPAVVLLLVGLRRVLLPGPLRGGDLLPYPDGAGLITRYLSGWHDSGATLSALDPSPAQLVLGLLQWVPGGLGPRLLLVIAPLVAWAAVMRALAPFLPSALPRTILALAYAMSPPVLTALATGDLVTLIVAVIVPSLAVLAATILDGSAPVERVWRRIATATVLLATMVAFAPPLIIVLPIVLVAGIGHALVAVEDRRWRRTLVLRSVALALLPLPLLGPWLLGFVDVVSREIAGFGATLGGHPVAWIALDPTARLAGTAGAALVLAGLTGALVASVASIDRTTFRTVISLMLLGLGLPLLAWWTDAAATAMRHGPLLVIAVAALVALAGVGLVHVPEVLSRHPFGWRQVGIGLASVTLVTLTIVGLVQHAVVGTPGLVRDEAVPVFVATLGPIPPDRLLLLGASGDGLVWEVVPATGPDLSSFGVRHDPVVHGLLTEAVQDLLSGADPRASARLGRLGVGIVLVPEGREDPTLQMLLRSQFALDPLPTLVGSLSRVSGAVPGAAIVRDAGSTERVPDPTVAPREVLTGIDRVSSDRFIGSSGAGGELLVAVPFGSGWRVLVDGVARPMLSDDGLLRVIDVAPDATVEVVAPTSTSRRTGLRLQLLGALLVISLGARPPAFALRNARRGAEDTE